ncbi:hypothetical protein JD844_000603 [Phrynosoma platyrhinos]|uniref:Piezo non-specific cation channel R-Ras-binding domain-containing protein n=1 Tax=Phrynosoma platyrhinos TaxID=52577 RepID=A0ABQ7SQP8_PHRPL|nr:hypothetical protein JD844_000603 [Phrynosoma platyrhinos]
MGRKRKPLTNALFLGVCVCGITVLHSGDYYLFETDSEEDEESVLEDQKPPKQSAFQVRSKGREAAWLNKKSNVVQRVLNTLRFLWVLCQATVDGLTQWLRAFTKEHEQLSTVLRLERYVLTQELDQAEEVQRNVLDRLYQPGAADQTSVDTALPGTMAGSPDSTASRQKQGTMEEKCHQLDQVVLDVVVCFLHAKDARREKGLRFIAHQDAVAVPREEAELEEILDHHHHLRKEKWQETMAVIQKRLLGRGMDSMAQRKTRMGRTTEMTEAVTMLLRMMMKAGCVFQPVRQFFRDILHSKYRAATDVYALMFLADVVDFIIIIFGFWAFGVIPQAFLVMLLIQFSTMVIDRALYLRKSVLGKLSFQVFLVFGIHVWMFFILPAVTDRMFNMNTVAQLWYFVKCIYFALSAYQIRCGYPTRILGNFLTKKYNHLNLFLFQGFRLVPFLVELRAVMDWPLFTMSAQQQSIEAFTPKDYEALTDKFVRQPIDINGGRDLGKGGTVEYTSEKHTMDLDQSSDVRRSLAGLLGGTHNAPVYLDVTVQLRRQRVGTANGSASFVEWWVIQLAECKQDCDILPMVIFNDKVSPPSLGFLAGYGIMGLYVSIVLVIGKFVRGFFSEISHSIMFEELPCVDRILKLCHDIFLVRETGELELEEELYAKLIFLYRSPETMIKWTREKE